MIQCSVKDFVKPAPWTVDVPIAAKLPCGVVASVDDVCWIGEIFIGAECEPRNSDLCNLASGEVTPKCDFIISMYLVPVQAGEPLPEGRGPRPATGISL